MVRKSTFTELMRNSDSVFVAENRQSEGLWQIRYNQQKEQFEVATGTPQSEERDGIISMIRHKGADYRVTSVGPNQICIKNKGISGGLKSVTVNRKVFPVENPDSREFDIDDHWDLKRETDKLKLTTKVTEMDSVFTEGPVRL